MVCSTAVPESTVRACLRTGVSCSRRRVYSVNLPLPLLQERLEGKATHFADEKAREIIKMEVGNRVTSQAHAAVQTGSSLLLLCIGPQRHVPPHGLRVRVQQQQSC